LRSTLPLCYSDGMTEDRVTLRFAMGLVYHTQWVKDAVSGHDGRTIRFAGRWYCQVRPYGRDEWTFIVMDLRRMFGYRFHGYAPTGQAAKESAVQHLRAAIVQSSAPLPALAVKFLPYERGGRRTVISKPRTGHRRSTRATIRKGE